MSPIAPGRIIKMCFNVLKLRSDFEDGVVKVRLRGACGSCPSALMTLKYGVEERLKEEIPEVKSVELA